MTLTITINLDNAAFGETDYERSAECARILRELAGQIARGLGPTIDESESVRDINGNRVGVVEVNV